MGSEGFIEEVVKRYGAARKKAKIARQRELAGHKPEAILAAVGKYYGIRAEQIKSRARPYTEPRYVASYLMRRYGLLGLGEIGERVGNAVQRVADHPTHTMAQALRELEQKCKNQES